jgi:serine/threonine protein kinase
MIGNNNQIKLIDFGISVLQKKKKSKMKAAGSLFYIAPEIFSEFYGNECDMWSLGVSFYQILTGKLPFKSKNQDKIFEKIL